MTTTQPGTLVTAIEWFAGGHRRPYDPTTASIRTDGDDKGICIFERVDRSATSSHDDRWTTFLPGFPDGSFGFARVNEHLTDRTSPRLFVEYLGQGDSDKPKHYHHSTIERADLVEALWKAHGVATTFVVTFDFSSLVLLELLARQDERRRAGTVAGTHIDEVLIINGGLFADCHTHPWIATPLLKSQVGRLSMWFTQRSRFMFGQILRSSRLFANDYPLSSAEVRENFDAIARRRGTAFLHHGAGFVDEHKANAERWDLARLFNATADSVTFHLAASIDDPFEPKQIVAARERLQPDGPDITMLPGGHMTTSEHPDLLAALIDRIRR